MRIVAQVLLIFTKIDDKKQNRLFTKQQNPKQMIKSYFRYTEIKYLKLNMIYYTFRYIFIPVRNCPKLNKI